MTQNVFCSSEEKKSVLVKTEKRLSKLNRIDPFESVKTEKHLWVTLAAGWGDRQRVL